MEWNWILICLSVYMCVINWLLRQWHPTPVLLPGKSHGPRTLVGCSPWDCWESDMTERLHFHFSLSYIGEGNGNPLQCSCLENPRDGGTCWAGIYGAAQSRTRLMWLSSSSKVNGNILYLQNLSQCLFKKKNKNERNSFSVHSTPNTVWGW